MFFVVVTEYNEPEDEEIPLSEDGTTIMSPGDDLETKTRRDTHRKFLEKQRSIDFDR